MAIYKVIAELNTNSLDLDKSVNPDNVREVTAFLRRAANDDDEATPLSVLSRIVLEERG